MAKLKATPKTYQEAAEYLAGRVQVKLGNNTWLEEVEAFQAIAVRLHKTNIVTFWADGRVILRSGGYHTVTTKGRINEFIRGSLYQKDYHWYVLGQYNGRDSRREFKEGIDVSWCQ